MNECPEIKCEEDEFSQIKIEFEEENGELYTHPQVKSEIAITSQENYEEYLIDGQQEKSDGPSNLVGENSQGKIQSDDYSYQSSLRFYSRKFMTEFIELYRSLPAVWKIKSKEYRDRNKKNLAYEELIKKVREVEPKADREMIVKKVNNIRSSFRRETKKILISKKKGQVYTPSLWYFDLLSFLREQETPSQSQMDDLSDCEDSEMTHSQSQIIDHSFDLIGDQSGQTSCDFPDLNLENKNKDEAEAPKQISNAKSNDQQSGFERIPEFHPKSTTTSSSSSGSNSSSRSISPIISLKRKNIKKVSNPKKIKLEECDFKEEDEFDVMGRHYAHKLRRLEPTQRIFAEKLICDVIFEAQLECLNRTSRVITSSSDNK